MFGSGTCEHSSAEPTAPPVEAPSTSDGGGGNGNGCFGQTTLEECFAARNVKRQVYKTTGYRLQANIKEIVIHGRATCQVLGPNSTDAQVLGVAQAAGQSLNIPQDIAFAFVIAVYVNFC